MVFFGLIDRNVEEGCKSLVLAPVDDAQAVELVNVGYLLAILEIRKGGVCDLVLGILSLGGDAATQLLHLPKGQAQMLPFSSQSLSKFQAG